MGWSPLRRALAVIVMLTGALLTVTSPTSEGVSANAAVLVSPPEGDIPDLDARGWIPVLDEEFDGAAVDESVWHIREENWQGVQARDALSVAGGELTMRTYTGADGINRTGSILSGGLGDHSPTWDGFEAAGGYVEARIKLPEGPTTLTAFWMMSKNGNNSLPFGDPAADGPEIDIMEHGNGPDSAGDEDNDGECDWTHLAPANGLPCNQFVTNNLHWDGFEEDHKSSAWIAANPNPSSPLQGNFHTYGLLWTPDEYVWFIDGVETSRSVVGRTFTPEHLILTNFVRSGHDYGPLGAATNNQTVVDYIKLWQRPVSDVPDQATPANTPLAVQFTVADYAFGSPVHDEPGTVIVTAESSNPDVVPADGVIVTGNGPGQPVIANPGFESGGTGWDLTGGATVDGGEVHLGDGALQLAEAGGRAEQTITGLRPHTTYVLDAHYEIDIGLNDTNGNGRADPGETFADPDDDYGRFSWGIADVDASRAGEQEIRVSHDRRGTKEQPQPDYWRRRVWPQEVVKFTTGPDTTSVVLFVDNAPENPWVDSRVSVDSVAIRPLVPHTRTVAIRPADGAVGTTTITLTARDKANTLIGTDTFQVQVDAGSLTDGRFQADATSTPWAAINGAEIVDGDPFQNDRELRLAQETPDAAVQTVSGLTPDTRYRLEVTGHNSQADGDFGAAVQSYGGAQLLAIVSGTASDTAAVEFVTDATANPTADVVLIDLNAADGHSTIEGVHLTRCATTTSCSGFANDPSVSPPDLSAVGPRSTASGRPVNVSVNLPAGATLDGVTSTNETLVPSANVGATGSGQARVIVATPSADQTGRTNLRVAYSGAAGSPVDIPLVVSDAALADPGFENGDLDWTIGDGASIVTSGQRRGVSALQVTATGTATQTIAAGVVPPGQPYTLIGWIDGTATVTVSTVPVSATEQPAILGTATWSGSGWSEQLLDFDAFQVTDADPHEWRGVQIDIAGDGGAATVDDLALIHRPVIRRMRDLSLHSGVTGFRWDGHRSVNTGRMSPNALWDPAAYTLTPSDIPGFGTGVVTADTIWHDDNNTGQLLRASWPYANYTEIKAGATTGRGRVTVQADDPATGRSTSRSFDVTVNAGDNFQHGDFERGTYERLDGGWRHAWLNDSAEIRHHQQWQYLGEHDTRWPYIGPTDHDNAMRISSGAVRFDDGESPVITGLSPNTDYTVRFRAKGNGSLVKVMAAPNIIFGGVLGSVVVDPPDESNVWREYEFTFTTRASGVGSESVALYLVGDTSDGPDDDDGDGDPYGGDETVDATDAIPASDRPCAIFAAGETCFDDIGLFLTDDVT